MKEGSFIGRFPYLMLCFCTASTCSGQIGVFCETSIFHLLHSTFRKTQLCPIRFSTSPHRFTISTPRRILAMPTHNSLPTHVRASSVYVGVACIFSPAPTKTPSRSRAWLKLKAAIHRNMWMKWRLRSAPSGMVCSFLTMTMCAPQNRAIVTPCSE